jgi:hypothetical protein
MANAPAGILHAETLTRIAQALVEDVSSLRKEVSLPMPKLGPTWRTNIDPSTRTTQRPDVPIAFIAHDIGGVIVKKVRPV